MRIIEPAALEVPYRHNGHDQTAPLLVYSTEIETGQKPIMILPGLGEDGLVAAKLVRQMEKLRVAARIGVLTFRNHEAIDSMCRKGPGILAAEINRLYGDDEDAPVNSIGHSQSGGSQLVAALDTPQFEGARHVSIAPVGPNSPFLGESEEERPREFWLRFARILKNPAPWRMGVDFTRRIASDTLGSRIRNGYNLLPCKVNYALSDDMHEYAIGGLKTLVSVGSVALITSNDDPLFPSHEVRSVLGQRGLEGVEQIASVGSHEPMISRRGWEQVQAALDFINREDAALS